MQTTDAGAPSRPVSYRPVSSRLVSSSLLSSRLVASETPDTAVRSEGWTRTVVNAIKSGHGARASRYRKVPATADLPLYPVK